MITTEQRRERIHELRNEGIAVPSAVYGALDQDRAPSDLLRSWTWSSHLWDRPVLSQYRGIENALASDQDAWDLAAQSIAGSLELRAERHAREAAVQRQRGDEDAALRASEADQVKADLRARFLRLPGTTAEEFELEYPTLLSDQRRRELDKAGAVVKSPISVRDMLAS